MLVQIAAAGLCHSDDQIRNGYMSAPDAPSPSPATPTKPPKIGGHEGSGVVVEIGDGVSGFAPGDHVVTSFVAVWVNAVGVPPRWNIFARPEPGR